MRYSLWIGYERAACRGKRAYETLGQAQAAATRRKGMIDTRSRSSMDVYRCRQCGAWHCGNPLDSTKEGRPIDRRLFKNWNWRKAAGDE
jgi:hypothetical protein